MEQALSLSPDNFILRITLIQALYEHQQLSTALSLLKEVESCQVEQELHQILAAKIFIESGDGENALLFLSSNLPEVKILKAKAYQILNEFSLAREFYVEAVKENSSLEDIDFARELRVAKDALDNSKRIKLTVVANDDTDAVEVTRLIKPREEVISFSEVGGLADVKKQIRKKIITPFQKPSLFQRFKKKVGGGILLFGPPGCGKTLLARATAGECNATFINVVISDILDMYIGESEKKLHAIFEQARQNTPSVIFFDEIESLAAKRQHTREATSAKLVSQFLSELDGFAQNNHGVLILGATNVPWALDPAFRRPGRFDRVVFIAPPDVDARTDILKGLLKDRPGGESVDAQKIARLTSGFSGADLMNLVETAVDEAIDHSIESGEEVPLNQTFVKEALKEVNPTTLEWLTMARNYAKYANDSGQYNEVLAFLRKHGK